MQKEFPKYDFYKTGLIESRNVISQSLKEDCERASITGKEIKPFDKFIIDE